MAAFVLSVTGCWQPFERQAQHLTPEEIVAACAWPARAWSLGDEIELLMEGWLEPAAAIGLHTHTAMEEVYCVLAGSLEVTTIRPDGAAEAEQLEAGDVHFVGIGQGHHGRAGPDGAWLLVAGRRP